MVLDILHKSVFLIMFIMFLLSNYFIALKFLQLKKKPNTELEEALSWTRDFRTGLWWLDFSATTAPLVGLFGTILALIEAFQKLSLKGVSGAAEISSAIGFALIATALGILLSLWNYFFFKLFQSKLSHYREELKHRLFKEVFSEG